jgi:hypothetical protein
MVRLAVVLAGALGVLSCQGRETPDPVGGGSGVVPEPLALDAPASVPIATAEDAGGGSGSGSATMVDEPPADPSKLIADLGAIPAWQAVVDRAQLLARRGSHGVVYGRVGPAILMLGPTGAPAIDGGIPIDAGLVPSPFNWLIDDTDGNGTLGIRVALAGKAAAPGTRVAVGGAWALDEQRRWYWRADSLQELPPRPAGAEPPDAKPAEPSHTVVMGNMPVGGGRMVKFARDNDAIYFQVVGPPPTTDGDGWMIADELGDPPIALLTLPGERASYGGQDMRSPDERWTLKRGQTYWVRIGEIRKREGKPSLMHARTGPIRVN